MTTVATFLEYTLLDSDIIFSIRNATIVGGISFVSLAAQNKYPRSDSITTAVIEVELELISADIMFGGGDFSTNDAESNLISAIFVFLLQIELPHGAIK